MFLKINKNSSLDLLVNSLKEELDKKLNENGYIIYVRKSMEEENKQVQSLEDQLLNCYHYAKMKKLPLSERGSLAKSFETPVTPHEVSKFTSKEAKELFKKYFVVIETWSAKKPFNRPLRRKIIEKINQWKINWIISYHPDRQARNLIEWSEIIELFDQWLVDLKYSTFDIQNTPSWKMMLWILFVLSKHYSDKLSLDIKRWIIWKLTKWKFTWNWKLYGYIRSSDWELEIDPIYWPLIKKAFQMKLKWFPENKIINFLNKHKIRIRRKNEKLELYEEKPTKITPNILRNILTNPIYAWLVFINKEELFPLYQYPELNFPVLVSLETFKRVYEIIKWKNKNNYSSLNQYFPLPNNFIITEDNYKCSPYIPSKYKKDFLFLIENNKDINIKVFEPEKIYYKIQNKSKVYIERKNKKRKNNISYKIIFENLIKPALKQINIRTTQIYIAEIIIESLSKELETIKHKKKEIIWSLNRYNSLLKQTSDPTKKENIEIKIRNLEKDLEEFIIEETKIINWYQQLFHIENVINNIEDYSYQIHQKLISILFEKILVTATELILYPRKILKEIFNSKNSYLVKYKF